MTATELLEAEQAAILDALEDMARQHIGHGQTLDRTLESDFISAHADTLRMLARHGRMRLVRDDGGRYVAATWVTP